MHHITFSESTSFTTALLVPLHQLNQTKLREHYVNKLDEESTIAFSLTTDGKKPSVKHQKAYLASLLKAVDSLGIELLLVCEPNYFKTLTKQTKTEPHYGYVMDCKIKDYEHLKVVLCPNYSALFYNPTLQNTIDLALSTVNSYFDNSYVPLGTDLIKYSNLTTDPEEIKVIIDSLYKYPLLTADVETFSLKFYETDIATISFAWNEHEGVAFTVSAEVVNDYLIPSSNKPIEQYLKTFFENYKGKLIWHNANFDLKIIVNSLWMTDLLDEEGKQQGIEVMTNNFEDTKLITYLATNSTSGNNLSLKHQAHEFAGNYAQESINDITLIPHKELLQYNLVDTMSTFYVFNKHCPTMLEDNQLTVYEEIFKPSVKVLLQVELTGMPLNMERVNEAELILKEDIAKAITYLNSNSLIVKYTEVLTHKAWVKEYESRVAKAKNPDKIKKKDFDLFPKSVFNPNSGLQVAGLLYEEFGLPILGTTDTGLPSTEGSILKSLKKHTDNQEYIEIIDNILVYVDAEKILSTFIKAFKNYSVMKPDGWYYLHGNFNLGGTVSGRLSSSQP